MKKFIKLSTIALVLYLPFTVHSGVMEDNKECSFEHLDNCKFTESVNEEYMNKYSK